MQQHCGFAALESQILSLQSLLKIHLCPFKLAFLCHTHTLLILHCFLHRLMYFAHIFYGRLLRCYFQMKVTCALAVKLNECKQQECAETCWASTNRNNSYDHQLLPEGQHLRLVSDKNVHHAYAKRRLSLQIKIFSALLANGKLTRPKNNKLSCSK